MSTQPQDPPRFDLDAIRRSVTAGEPPTVFVALDGSRWSRVIFGESGVICGWTEAGEFTSWAPAEEIAEAVFRAGKGVPS